MNPVAVISPSLSGNAVGRAMVFVDLLSALRPVVLVGRSSGPLWLPLATRRDIDVVDLGSSRLPSAGLRRRLRDSTTIAVKPLASSYGQWLLSPGRGPAILDIDDPELALAAMDLRTLARSATRLDGVLIPAMIALRGRANGLTVASSALQRRYGGIVIPHARHAQLSSTDRASRSEARSMLGLEPDVPLVVFVGTIRPHKGVDLLIACADRIGNARIAVVGVDRPMEAPESVMVVPPVEYRDALRWLAAADVVAIPQRDGWIGRLQAPAKAVDALSMGRAIVASDVPPVREMIAEAGHLVESGSVDALADGINLVLGDIALRERLEERARTRFLERYSIDAVQPTMRQVLEAAEAA